MVGGASICRTHVEIACPASVCAGHDVVELSHGKEKEKGATLKPVFSALHERRTVVRNGGDRSNRLSGVGAATFTI